jgi:branched-subunit amino acid aminotransferase/4-amino-4-deoxychorismate lyase
MWKGAVRDLKKLGQSPDLLDDVLRPRAADEPLLDLAGDLVIRNARLFDSRDLSVTPGTSVLVHGDRIVRGGRVAEIGEPFRSFYNPQALSQALTAMGFSQARDLDAREVRAKAPLKLAAIVVHELSRHVWTAFMEKDRRASKSEADARSR